MFFGQFRNCIENGIKSTNLRKTLRSVQEKRTFEHITASKCKKIETKIG